MLSDCNRMFLASLCVIACVSVAGAYEREGYFNGSAYIRLASTLSLRHHIGLSFRTCHGGELFSQQKNDSGVSLEVHADWLLFTVRIGQKQYESRLRAGLLDNTWHTINIVHRLGNLTLVSGGHQQVIANSTYNADVLQNADFLTENAVLIVGNNFRGCILDGPGFVFNTSNQLTVHNVEWGRCPLTTNSCTKTDYCSTDPCIHGTCISVGDRYECHCTPRYSGKNCERDNGSPCNRNGNPCLNNGRCDEDSAGNYVCHCGPGHTGQHCESEISSHLCEKNPCRNEGSCRVSAVPDKYECICRPGFDGDNCESNINECRLNPCQHEGICIDGINNYTCLCERTGYQGNNCEININECFNNPCLNDGICFDNYGGYTCQCTPGFEGYNCEMNLDECSSAPCQNNGICLDQVGTYQCNCLTGFTGHNCEMVVNMCDSVSCPQNSECLEGTNAPKCFCKPGYIGSPPNCVEATSCQDQGCLNGGTCNSLDYTCVCPPGFTGAYCELEKRHAALMDWCSTLPCRNGGTCLDNECHCAPAFSGSVCEHSHVRCIDNPCRHGHCSDYNMNTYHCVCDPGWDGRNCDQVSSPTCKIDPCRNAGTCVDTGNSFYCECPPAFAGKMCQTNLNDCDPNPCVNGGLCTDQANGFTCNCTDGYSGAVCDREPDACSSMPCHNEGTCIGQRGGRDYHCVCLSGYTGTQCEQNINDCSGVVCPDGQGCVDGLNAHECRAISGERCINNLCQNNATCQDDSDSYSCICPPGFSGRHCENDIDECIFNQSLCNFGICKNNFGSYECYCRPGYTGDHCNLDFNECDSTPCKNNATCTNKVNNFLCSCPPGYTGNVCSIDINECDSSPCYGGATCLDEIASFSCLCPPGLTGKMCETNINECESSPCQHGGLCLDETNAYSCNCLDTGYEGIHCENNIDDCVGNQCTNGGTCIDDVKKYECSCYPGFVGPNCEIDINECESSPCKHNGTCLQYSNASLYLYPEEYDNSSKIPVKFYEAFSYNSAAGYACICVDGVIGDNCETNIQECDSNPCHVSSGTCVDRINDYYCECEPGFEGRQCENDIDECERYHPCVNAKSCQDRRDDYSCDCLAGYGGKNCSVKLIGCLEDSCLNNGTCKPYLEKETEHKFNCSCSNGFHGSVCEKITTMSLKMDSYVMANTSREEGYDIQLRFKTTLPSGLIALGQGLTYYILQLLDGRLNLHSSILNKWEGVFIGSDLNDSNWHKVFVAINNSHLVLAANEEQTIYPIIFQDNTNISHTNFPSTYLGNAPSVLSKLPHGPPYFIGCMEDIVVNNKWVLPNDTTLKDVVADKVEVGCPRTEQCRPNPCANNGVCADKWSEFKCDCKRPYLGHTCQYTLTPATFGYENLTGSLVTVNVTEAARKAVRSIVDISMFVQTREDRGDIFYMGTIPQSEVTSEDTFIAAQLDGGELLVRIRFNGTLEHYTVGGVKLSDGNSHLIQVVRNVTLVQVKINSTEYFRKTISATGQLNVQVLYLGGLPAGRLKRQIDSHDAHRDLTVSTTFKGIIQDVQIKNGVDVMVVQFFPLEVEGLDIPTSFGPASFDVDLVLKGVRSDNSCRSDPCMHNGICRVTWNDFRCECPRGYKGKKCQEMEFCQLQDCPLNSTCRNLDNGYECIANITFDGRNSSLHFDLNYPVDVPDETLPIPFDSIEINYRSQIGGTILYIASKSGLEYVSVSVLWDEVTVAWNLNASTQGQLKRFKKEPDGNWSTILLKMKDGGLQGGFNGASEDTPEHFSAGNFPLDSWNELVQDGNIVLGSGADIPGLRDLTSRHYENTNEVHTANPVDTYDTSSEVSFSTLTGSFFKGCLGEVRIGGLLLPFFTAEQLKSDNYTGTDYFLLSSEPYKHIGCVLCFESECQNNATCLEATEAYRCSCPPGFEKDDCSVDIDECQDNRCENNATCVDGQARYDCECQLGYEGQYCEEEIDECASNPCQYNGSCMDRLGGFECNCTDEYMGTHCEYIRPITCENLPCHIGATCMDIKNPSTKDNFTCSCVPGYEGTLCNVPYCEISPCQNGQCVQVASRSPKCDCVPGFTGRYCEENIDECAVKADRMPPCQHRGLCVDGIDSFACDCRNTGYEGELCEVDIDECNLGKVSCGQGRCVNVPGSYNCACDEGACGTGCQFRDPCIDKQPCQHDGVCTPNCVDLPNYTCECTGLYTGDNCSDPVVAQGNNAIDIAIIVAPIVGALILIGAISVSFFVSMARKKRATRGTYSPSSQEYCNPRVEMDNVMKPPPEERLI